MEKSMNDQEKISPFRILDWRLFRFNCLNALVKASYEIEHKWTIKAHVDRLDEEDILKAAILIDFSLMDGLDPHQISLDGQCIVLCEMEKEKVVDPEKTFQNLISHVALVNGLANLRVFLLQAGNLHQMGPKPLMLPFVNLNAFSFDEEISFSV